MYPGWSASGGKDSTALTMLLLETMEQLPPRIRNQKDVYITCVNTLVEAPPVIDHVLKFIERLKIYVDDMEMPIKVVELQPETDQDLLGQSNRERVPCSST